MNKTNTLCD